MSRRIAADANAYGTYARISALADYVEVCVLKSVRVTKARLADLIEDNGWQLRELMEGPDDEDIEQKQSAAQSVAQDAADRVYAMLAERADLLGELYPFAVTPTHLEDKHSFDRSSSAYVSILALTIAHAFGLSSDPAPTRVLEDIVEEVLRKKLQLAINFGAVRRAHSPFEAAVNHAGPLIKLSPLPKSAWRSKFANDENVDVIGHIYWGDSRAGTWAVIGQATCAKSDEWEKKLDEPKPAVWRDILGVKPQPLVLLAVPHHVEGKHLSRLASFDRGIVLDRLRLTQTKMSVSGDEAAIVAKVLAAELEPI